MDVLASDSSDLVRRLAVALASAAPRGLVSAYLFGSRACGRSHRESDLDLGVLVSRNVDAAERFAERIRLAGLLPGLVGIRDVDLVVLNDAPPHLARHIVLDGIRVACADPEADHAFRRDVQLRAADLAPFLARTRAVKLEALAR
ncbi:MAG TPA: nucleotidyltransferase domain-containing protein [Thermoanaerobaculia bacterium]|nr:nucleotidyltransferase domain-containing protein [Thermoanaerobaculia bacterium]